MKIKALMIVLGSFLTTSLQAGPAVQVFVGGNNAACFRPAAVIGRPAPVVCRPALGPTLPIVYQPYGAAYLSPIYYGVGPTTVTYTSTSAPVSTYSPVTPLVVLPPVNLNRPVMVYDSATFSWKR